MSSGQQDSRRTVTMMASPLKKVGTTKCCVCRHDRQKCVSIESENIDRIWIEGGRQDKCARCTKLGHDCGPPEYPSPSDEGDLRSPISHSRKRRASEIPQTMGRDCALLPTPTHSGAGTPGPSRITSDDEFPLTRRFTEIDRRLEALKVFNKEIASVNLPILEGDLEVHARFQSLCQAKEAILTELLSMLRWARISATAMTEGGNSLGAYAACARILENYRKIDEGVCYEVKCVLINMARLAWANKDDLHAQELAWNALASRYRPPRADPSDLDLLKDIAKSKLQTWPEVKPIVQSEMTSQAISKCDELLPPLHEMMASPYAFEVVGNILQSGPHPDITGKSPESPIVGGIDAILDFLGVFTDAQIEERDANGRTSLFFAAFHCKEGLGLALMVRAKNEAKLLHRLVTSRDRSGQTVLSIGISSKCSLPFIKALIDHGAEVSPVAVSMAMTPLQTACSRESLETVDLLVTRGATIDAAYPGSMMPLAIAEQQGNFDIANLLRYSAPEYLGSHTPREGDYGG